MERKTPASSWQCLTALLGLSLSSAPGPGKHSSLRVQLCQQEAQSSWVSLVQLTGTL